MLLAALLTACTGKSADSTPLVVATPTIAFVSPHDGDTVGIGDLPLSIVVNDFLLSDPAKHNDGEPAGYMQIDWTDGTTPQSMQTGSTTPTISLPTAGSWTITADLYFTDGDGMSESFTDFVPATITVNAQPG